MTKRFLLRNTKTGKVGEFIAEVDNGDGTFSTPVQWLGSGILEALMITYQPNGTDQLLAVDGTVKMFTPYTDGTTDVMLTFMDATVCYTVDGSDPTTLDAHEAEAGTKYDAFPVSAFNAMKVTQKSGAARIKASPLKRVSL